MTVIIIDPSSPEVNRGSYCYMPYLLYSALSDSKKQHDDVWFIEDFTIAEDMNVLKNLRKDIKLLCALWSYPQIETCMALYLFAKEAGINMEFFGYEPLIQRLGLPLYHVDKSMILHGMASYVKYILQNVFDHILLSDCDKHLSDLPNNTVIPMFTSYGCPRACKFCSASLNTKHKRWKLELTTVSHNLEITAASGIDGIHFTDEDFFFDTNRAIATLARAYDINPNFQIIALGHTNTFQAFCDVVKTQPEIQHKMQVLKLVEIGLETADLASASLSLGKTGVASPYVLKQIAKNPICKVLWLTMTFYPGDTVKSMNATGRFLRIYGLDPSQLCERIRTNGTEGGLGQFYQFYDGCITQAELEAFGKVLTTRPMRLWPSYLPDSFMQSVCELDTGMMDARLDKYMHWCKTNKCSNMAEKVLQAVKQKTGKFQICEIINAFPDNYITKTEVMVALATMARLEIILGQ